MTSKELADFLRIKQRKVYDLAASGRIPCSRAMGKLLFPRAEIEAWVAQGMGGTGFAAAAAAAAPNVVLGSHDPLLDWALRQSRSGLATFFDGSADGLDRFTRAEGVAAGLHMFDPEGSRDAGDDAAWNIGWARRMAADMPCVLVEFAWRERGLMFRPGGAGNVHDIGDLRGRLIVPRQPESGAQALLEHLMGQAWVAPEACTMTEPARTETEAAEMAAAHGGAVAFGLRASANQFGLAFAPVLRERFDLLVDRKAWFEPPFQRFLAFCGTREFTLKAAALEGYDVSGLGTVHFVGA